MRRSLLVAVGFYVALWPLTASAQPARTIQDEASATFKQGKAAEQAGDVAAAAGLYARADQLVPNDVALDAALEMAIRADDALLGMELFDRSRRSPAAASSANALAARAKFAGRVGKLTLRCASCTAVIDGAPAAIGQPRYVTAGEHVVVFSDGARSERKLVAVEADRETEAPMSLPVVVRKVEVDTLRRVHPALFFVGAGLTLAGAGGVLASALDTRSQHDDFLAAPSEDAAQAGEAAQLRTNALIGVTAGLGVATALVGVFTDWRRLAPAQAPSPPRAEIAFFVDPWSGAASGFVTGAFE